MVFMIAVGDSGLQGCTACESVRYCAGSVELVYKVHKSGARFAQVPIVSGGEDFPFFGVGVVFWMG